MISRDWVRWSTTRQSRPQTRRFNFLYTAGCHHHFSSLNLVILLSALYYRLDNASRVSFDRNLNQSKDRNLLIRSNKDCNHPRINTGQTWRQRRRRRYQTEAVSYGDIQVSFGSLLENAFVPLHFSFVSISPFPFFLIFSILDLFLSLALEYFNSSTSFGFFFVITSYFYPVYYSIILFVNRALLMASIRSLLNPLPEIDLSPRHDDHRTIPRIKTSTTSHPGRQRGPTRYKVPKDAPVFKEDDTKGEVRYLPCEDSSVIIAREHQKLRLFPTGMCGGIIRYPRTIPYKSDKKSFEEKTGRSKFEGMCDLFDSSR